MPIFLSLLVFLALYLRPSLGWKYDEGVLVLTDNNYVKVKAEFPEMLIEFYAPWCGQCKKLAPEWSKAAKMFSDSPITFAKVDATKHEKLTKHFKVEGFPTIRHLKDSIVGVEYNGADNAVDIALWVNDMFLGEEGPKVLFEYDDSDSQGIFGTGVQKYLFILTEEGETTITKNILDACQTIAPFFSGEVKVVRVSSIHRRFLSAFGIFANPQLQNKLPMFVTAEIISSNFNGGMIKNYFDGSKNVTEIEKILTGLVDGGIPTARLRTEEIKETDTEGPLTILRAKSFDELVVANHKDVLVLFCMSWDEQCKTLEPIYKTIAQKVASSGNSDHLSIAYLENEANELDCTCICSGLNFTEAEVKRQKKAEEGGRLVNRCGFSREEANVAKAGEVIVRQFPTVYLFQGHSIEREDDDPTNSRLLDARYVKGRKFKAALQYDVSSADSEQAQESSMWRFLQLSTYHPVIEGVVTDSTAPLRSSNSEL